MDRAALRSLVSTVLNFNSTQTAQDFTTANLNTALNEAYNDEVNLALNNGLDRYFLRVQEFTWEASTVRKELPKALQGKVVLNFLDVTEDTIGSDIDISDLGSTSTVFFYDKKTLQWGTTGPGSDTTVRAVYLNVAVEMTQDNDEPDALPSQYHSLIAWSAACWLKRIAEEQAPNEWERYLADKRDAMHKFMSKGRPVSDTPRIKQLNPVSADTYI
jgi:hypothetical protein